MRFAEGNHEDTHVGSIKVGCPNTAVEPTICAPWFRRAYWRRLAPPKRVNVIETGAEGLTPVG